MWKAGNLFSSAMGKTFLSRALREGRESHRRSERRAFLVARAAGNKHSVFRQDKMTASVVETEMTDRGEGEWEGIRRMGWPEPGCTGPRRSHRTS